MKDLKKHGLSFVEFETIPDGESNAVAKELIENLFMDMAKLCTKYHNDTFCDLPYTYNERVLDCVLLPALSKLCDTKVLVEIPTTRKCSNRRFQIDEYNGRIDYWCIYKNYSFVIEFKHSFDCFTTDTTRRHMIKRWIKMNEQLQSIDHDIKGYEEKTKGIIRIGLHIITSYSNKCPYNQLLKQFRGNITENSNRFLKDLSRKYPSLKPDLMICWKIPTKIVMDSGIKFPGLWAIVKIYPTIKHCGSIE